MEVGVGNHSVAGFGEPGKSFSQCLDDTAAAGYEHVLLLSWEGNPGVDAKGEAASSFVNLPKSDLLALSRAVSRRGMRVSCIYPGFGIEYEADKLPATLEKLKQYREIAWQLGCHTMVFSSIRAEKPLMPHATKRAALDQIAVLMDEISSDKPGEIFKMAVDTHFHTVSETIEDCEYLLSRAHNVNSGLCLNIGNLYTLGQKGWEILLRWPERVHIVTWKDHTDKGAAERNRPFLALELGKGDTPLTDYAEAWKRVADKSKAIHLVTVEDVEFAERTDVLTRSRDFVSDILK